MGRSSVLEKCLRTVNMYTYIERAYYRLELCCRTYENSLKCTISMRKFNVSGKDTLTFVQLHP